MTDRIWLARHLRRLRTELRQHDRKIGHRAAEVRCLNAEIRRLGNELAQAHETLRKIKATDRALRSELLHKQIAVFLRTCGISKTYLAVEAAAKEFDVSQATVYAVLDEMKAITRFDPDDKEFEALLRVISERKMTRR